MAEFSAVIFSMVCSTFLCSLQKCSAMSTLLTTGCPLLTVMSSFIKKIPPQKILIDRGNSTQYNRFTVRTFLGDTPSLRISLQTVRKGGVSLLFIGFQVFLNQFQDIIFQSYVFFCNFNLDFFVKFSIDFYSNVFF